MAQAQTDSDYTALNLHPQHVQQLLESAISPAVAAARGYRTITDPKELTALGFARSQLRVPGLLLPLHTTDGSQPYSVYRPDHPRTEKNKDGKEKARKYEMLAKQGMRIDCPPSCRALLADPKGSLWVTEGQKKGDAIVSHGGCAIALLGVWNFKGRNLFGGVTILADFDSIAWNGRDVRIVFDKDLRRNPHVQKALERLIEHLQRKGAHVSVVYLPPDGPKGVDDYLASGKTLRDLEALLEGPRSQLKAAADGIELLDCAPDMMSRPLALINGRAYAATWGYVKRTRTETRNKDGEIIKLNPPEVTTEQRLFVLASDGTVYGDGGDKPLSELGVDVHLPEVPTEKQRWSTPGLKAYRAGTRPEPWDVFTRVLQCLPRRPQDIVVRDEAG